METEDHFLLLRGVKNMLRCDDAEVVQGIARYVVSQHRSLRLLSALIERTRNTPLPGIISLIGWLRSFLAVSPEDSAAGAAWIARLTNERRAVEKLPRLVPQLDWAELKFRSVPGIDAVNALWRSRRRARANARRIFRITRLLHRQYDFFKVLRVVELIAYYTRYLEIFRERGFSLAVMSNHSNPHGIANNLAARKRRVPTVLITHGMPVRPVARLWFDLAVVHCAAAREAYREEECRFDRVLIHGRRQHYGPMPAGRLPERLRVGVFLCKDVNEERLRGLADHLLLDHRVAKLLIRPHPKNLCPGLNAWIASRNDGRLCRSDGGSVIRDVQRSDIVLAGNSSVLIDAVVAGRPSGYVTGLDNGSPDLHRFVARGLIFPIDGERCCDFAEMLHFYRRPEWPAVLRLFANIEEDEVSVTRRAGELMVELAGLHRARRHPGQ